MMQRDWISSEVVQPLHGQPVWVYHDGLKDIYGQQHVEGVYKSIFRWDANIHSDTPHWWEIPLRGGLILSGGLYGNRMWQSRLDDKKPEPPSADLFKLPDIKPILAHERPLE